MSGKALTLIALLAVLAAAVCVAETCDASGSFSGEFRQNVPWEHPGEPFSGPHEGPGHAGPPVYIDASGSRDVSPRGMIAEYAGMFAEKERLESFGHKVYVFDPRLSDYPDSQLSHALTEVMGGDVVPGKEPAEGIRVPVPEPRIDGRFLELLLDQVRGTGTELEALLLDMLRESIDETQTASVQEFRADYAEVPSDGETDDSPKPFVPSPVPEVTQEETFLRLSLFDGGSSFSA